MSMQDMKLLSLPEDQHIMKKKNFFFSLRIDNEYTNLSLAEFRNGQSLLSLRVIFKKEPTITL